jgi:hypothetical protein
LFIFIYGDALNLIVSLGNDVATCRGDFRFKAVSGNDNWRLYRLSAFAALFPMNFGFDHKVLAEKPGSAAES